MKAVERPRETKAGMAVKLQTVHLLEIWNNLKAKVLHNPNYNITAKRGRMAGMVSGTGNPPFGNLEEKLQRKYMHGLERKVT